MHRPRQDCSPLSVGALYGRIQRVTITDAVNIQFDLLRMSIVLLETCRGSYCNIYYDRIKELCIKLVIETNLYFACTKFAWSLVCWYVLWLFYDAVPLCQAVGCLRYKEMECVENEELVAYKSRTKDFRWRDWGESLRTADRVFQTRNRDLQNMQQDCQIASLDHWTYLEGSYQCLILQPPSRSQTTQFFGLLATYTTYLPWFAANLARVYSYNTWQRSLYIQGWTEHRINYENCGSHTSYRRLGIYRRCSA